MKETNRTQTGFSRSPRNRKSRGYEPQRIGTPAPGGGFGAHARPTDGAEGPAGYSRARYGQEASLNRRKRRGDHFLSFVIVVAAAVFVASLVALGLIWYGYHSSTKMYDEVAEQAVISEEASDLSGLAIDWQYLRSVNPDVVAWIYMPGTEINYPIVRGISDDQYLWTNFDGKEGAIVKKGSIFLSSSNSGDMSDDASFVFGHNMHDGTMFSLLEQMVNDTSLFDANRTFYVLTPAKNYQCSTFALDRVNETKIELIQPSFASSDELQSYLSDRVTESLVPQPEDVDLASSSKVFALVSCAVHNDGTRVMLFGSVVDAATPANASDAAAAESVEDVAAAVESDEATAGQ